MKKPRNYVVLDAILNHKGGYMRHRLDRRAKEQEDVRYYFDEEDDECSPSGNDANP